MFACIYLSIAQIGFVVYIILCGFDDAAGFDCSDCVAPCWFGSLGGFVGLDCFDLVFIIGGFDAVDTLSSWFSLFR